MLFADFRGSDGQTVRVILEKVSSITFIPAVESSLIAASEDFLKAKVHIHMDNKDSIVVYHAKEEFDEIVSEAVYNASLVNRQ